jgi:hypothetical protein
MLQRFARIIFCLLLKLGHRRRTCVAIHAPETKPEMDGAWYIMMLEPSSDYGIPGVAICIWTRHDL